MLNIFKFSFQGKIKLGKDRSTLRLELKAERSLCDASVTCQAMNNDITDVSTSSINLDILCKYINKILIFVLNQTVAFVDIS